jgi:hypothetical protein
LPESVSPLESLLPQALEGFEEGLEELIDGALAGVSGPIGGRAGVEDGTFGLRRWGKLAGAHGNGCGLSSIG